MSIFRTAQHLDTVDQADLLGRASSGSKGSGVCAELEAIYARLDDRD